jgi:hypothetical protein
MSDRIFGVEPLWQPNSSEKKDWCVHLQIISRSLQRMVVFTSDDSDLIWCEEHKRGAAPSELAERNGEER